MKVPNGKPVCVRRLTAAFALVIAGLLLSVQSISPAKAQDSSGNELASERVPLFYLRQASKLAPILAGLAADKASAFSGLSVTAVDDSQLAIYGTRSARSAARRFVAALDLPLPAVRLEMWGLQLSSNNPKQMEKVVRAAQGYVSDAKEAVRQTSHKMQVLASRITLESTDPSNRVDNSFFELFTNDPGVGGLGYASALSNTHALSLTDVLLRLIAARDPAKANVDFANKLEAWLDSGPYREYAKSMWSKGRPPFSRMFSSRGLRAVRNPTPGETGQFFKWDVGPDGGDAVDQYALEARRSVLRFALEYADYIENPGGFSAYRLSNSAEALNTRLQLAVDALNSDLEDLFLTRTLELIEGRLADFRDVEYAQVGRTSVAALHGVEAQVTASSVSTFDVTPPLRLSELLSKAASLQSSVAPFIPNQPETQKDPMTGKPTTTSVIPTIAAGIPYSEMIGLIAAMGEERSVWRELTQGATLDVTPNILRNGASAELKVHLTVGDPQGATTEAGVRPLSRISKHEVQTIVYLDSLDLFDLSTFSSEALLSGDRGYVPILGPIWHGIFGDVPVFGSLFSWRRGPKRVYHQSILLSDAVITPTAMSVGLLYPIENRVAHRTEVGRKDLSTLRKSIDDLKISH